MLIVDKTMDPEDQTNVQDLEANSYDDDTNEEESEAGDEASNVQTGDADEDGGSAERAGSQIDRLKAEKKELQDKLARLEGKEGGSQEVASNDRLDRIELKSEGVKYKADQDFVMEYASSKGISLSEALASRVVKVELRAMDEERKTKSSSPGSNNRVNGGVRDEVAYWVSKYDQGKMAPTRELRRKVRLALKKR